jgi:hypothetical protein
MCTITLSYDKKDAVAREKLAILLSSGLFTQLDESSDLDIDYNDPWLYEDHGDLPPLPEGKDHFTLEELREILINDLNEAYNIRKEDEIPIHNYS